LDEAIKRLVIVGGGSAGWLAAGVIAAEHQAHQAGGLQVTLIESPDVKTIGVGEGTWPTMRDTLRKMGISETDLIRECDASFKQGSKFVNWVTAEADDQYYHPFVLPQGFLQANLVSAWQARHTSAAYSELVSFQPHLCEQGRAPKQTTTPEFAAVANYAYHLDAGKFAELLRRHCTEKLGVSHILDHVTGVACVGVDGAWAGDIQGLQTRHHGLLEGDLFIDCTGFASLLLGQHFGIPFVSQKQTLFNDTALAVQVPYSDDADAIASHTLSTAQHAGWIWDIGLPTRRGVGYVYSSAHTTDDQAETDLRHYIEQSSGIAADKLPAPRKIGISPGYRQKFWHKNCVAVGMSAGFLEPLEASALVLVELSAAMISDELPATRGMMEVVARRFNARFSYRWERIVEFLKLHYVLSRRTDSDYWHDNRDAATIPDRLLESLDLWRYQSPSRYDLYQAEEIFPSASYHYVLYGMGFVPQVRPTTRRSDDAMLGEAHFKQSAGLTRKYLAGLPTNRELINHVKRHGMPRL
jgi:tryptophan halogenase